MALLVSLPKSLRYLDVKVPFPSPPPPPPSPSNEKPHDLDVIQEEEEEIQEELTTYDQVDKDSQELAQLVEDMPDYEPLPVSASSSPSREVHDTKGFISRVSG